MMHNFEGLIGHKVQYLYAPDGETYQAHDLWMITDKGEYAFDPEGD